MKKSLRYFAFALLSFVTVGVTGCAAVNDGANGAGAGRGEGTVVFSLTHDFSVNTRVDGALPSSQNEPEAVVYSVQIVDAKGEVVRNYDDHRQIPAEVRLAAGTYRVVASSGGVDVEGAGAVYGGSAEFTVAVGGREQVEVLCTLVNVKVSIGFAQVIKDNFTHYSVEVSNVVDGGVGAFSNSGVSSRAGSVGTVSAAEGGVLYFGATGVLTWKLRLTNTQGDDYEFNHVIYGVNARDHYILNFDIEAAGDGIETDGSSLLHIVVNKDLEVIEHNYGIVLEKGPAPTFVGDGFDVSSVVVVNEDKRGVSALVNVAAACGLQELSVRHYSAELEGQGMPRYMNLLTIVDPELIAAINRVGLSWSGALNGLEATIDFSELGNTLPLGEHVFDVLAYDAMQQEVRQRIVFNVLPDMDHQPLVAEPMAKFAVLRGQWNTLVLPEGLTFEYATQAEVDGGAEWTRVDGSLVVVGGEGRSTAFSARVTGLIPSTTYHFRTYSTAGGVSKATSTFETEAAPELPNLSFDASYKSGKSWYFNASGGNSFWATGNDGLTGFIPNWDSNTVRVEGEGNAVKGAAVRMTSWGGVPVVKHAAGNLFTGDFKTDMGDPKSSPKFGRPYTGRPIGMRGWFKYKTAPITVNVGNHSGENDQCHIYVSLEDWQGASSRPGNRIVVGYGEFKTAENVATYTPFSFDIVYPDPNRKPTHIVLTATSSIYGGDFCGSEGAELFVDEFELIWE